MENLKTGFSHIDEIIGGLRRGELYFVSALNREITRRFVASLCASVNSFGADRAIFYTDSPIPYCRCEHIHFANVEEVIDFLRLSLNSEKVYKLPKTNMFILEDFDLLSVSAFHTWPCDKHLQKHLYESCLIEMKTLATEFQATLVLADQLYDNNITAGLNCDFPDIRYEESEGTFHLSELGNGILRVCFLNHRNFDSLSFQLNSKPKRITQTYTIYTENNI